MPKIKRQARKLGRKLGDRNRWDAFGAKMGRAIRLMTKKERQFIVIGCRDPTRYVQFASLQNGGIKGEAASNYYLADSEKLTAATCRELAQLGWKGPRKRGNYWRRWRAPVPVPEIVSLAVATLHEVFRVASSADLNIKRGVFPPSKTSEPDHFVVGVVAASLLLGYGYRFVIGAPCGHKHVMEADAMKCLAAKQKARRTTAALYQRYGRIFPVDREGVPLAIKWTAKELARINK